MNFGNSNNEWKHTNCSLSSVGSIKLNNTSTAGAAVRLILDFSAVNLANGGEQIDQVLIASRPRQLGSS